MSDALTAEADQFIALLDFRLQVKGLVGSAPHASNAQILSDVWRMVNRAYPIPECPGCGADLTGEPIPQDQRWMFGGALYFDRRIGEYDSRADRTIGYRCSICNHRWSR